MIFVGRRGLYRRKNKRVGFLKYGKRNYNWGQKKSPYRHIILDQDPGGQLGRGENRRTRWSKEYIIDRRINYKSKNPDRKMWLNDDPSGLKI